MNSYPQLQIRGRTPAAVRKRIKNGLTYSADSPPTTGDPIHYASWNDIAKAGYKPHLVQRCAFELQLPSSDWDNLGLRISQFDWHRLRQLVEAHQ